MSRRISRGALRVIIVLGLSSGVSILLYVMRVIATDSWRYWFMLWNLTLAWLPLAFAFWLRQRLAHSRWLSWPNVLISLAWLGFLPNSFYMVSDLVHLSSTGEIVILYDVALMTSLIANGMILGYISTYIIHKELLKRLKTSWAHTIIALIFVSCGFAIYLGRYLRWNSWDLILNPAGVLFDVSESLIHPLLHAEAYFVTFTFFILIASLYAVSYELVHLFQNSSK